MAVNVSWTLPTGATLDLPNGFQVTETNWDALVSNVYRLGGTDGNAKTGPYYIGGTTFSNARMTTGLTVNQGASDDEALALKSSDVAHGRTDTTETDTYAVLKKLAATTGGLHLQGYSEDIVGIELLGAGNNADSTKAAGSLAQVMVRGYTDQVTGFANLGNADNVFGVINGAVAAVFFVAGDGDVYNRGGSTAMVTFDDDDDGALLETVGTLMNPDRVKDYRFSLATDLAAHKETLATSGVIALDPDDPMGFMISYKGILGLLIDGIRQVTHEHRQLAARVAPLLSAA